MRLFKASPPNIPTAAAQRSLSPSSASSPQGSSHHFAVVAIFFFWGLIALTPVLLVPLSGPGSGVPLSPLVEQLLGSPSTWFPPAMICAGVFARYTGLLPQGISFSLGRIMGGVLIGFLAYPVGFVSILLAVVGLLGSALSSLDRDSRARAAVFEQVVAYLTVGGIVFVGGMLTVLIITAAFAIATRYWPRFAFRWIVLLIGTAILGGIIVGVIHYKISLPMLPNRFAFQNFLGDPFQVFFSVIWGIPLVVLVGQPLLAALVGHWLYLAAKEWSAESA